MTKTQQTNLESHPCMRQQDVVTVTSPGSSWTRWMSKILKIKMEKPPWIWPNKMVTWKSANFLTTKFRGGSESHPQTTKTHFLSCFYMTESQTWAFFKQASNAKTALSQCRSILSKRYISNTCSLLNILGLFLDIL